MVGVCWHSPVQPQPSEWRRQWRASRCLSALSLIRKTADFSFSKRSTRRLTSFSRAFFSASSCLTAGLKADGESIDAVDAVRMITAVTRAERFVEGTFGEQIRNGTLHRLLSVILGEPRGAVGCACLGLADGVRPDEAAQRPTARKDVVPGEERPGDRGAPE